MGEIISKPTPKEPLEFNGERLTSSFGGQTAIEHWHRYLMARELARGRDVLDMACGEGYGSALLCQTARSVVGVDISPEAIQHAQCSYVSENLRYVEGNALDIPLPKGSVDLVVSFETLEHFLQHDRFLGEIKRVLRPDGFLLISTPDRDNYTLASTPPNPYHKLELTTEEFLATLRRYFSIVSWQGQRVLLGSALLGTDAACRSTLCFERRGPAHFEASVGMSRARYIVALASDNSELNLPDSVFIDTDQLFNFDGPTLERYHTETHTVDAALARVAALESALEMGVAQLAAAQKEDGELKLELEVKEGQLAGAQQQIGELKAVLDIGSAQLAATQKEDGELKLELEVREGQLAVAQQQIGELKAVLDIGSAQLAVAEQQIRELKAELDMGSAQLVAAQQENHELKSCLRQHNDQLKRLSSRYEHLEQVVAEVFNSSSWRLSAPIRFVGKLLHRRRT